MQLRIHQRITTSAAWKVTTRLTWYVVLLALSLCALHNLHGFIVDDAFITFRYARNLATGIGWTFNGTNVMISNGATAPLYVIALSLMYKISPHMQANANALLIACMTIAGAFLFEAFYTKQCSIAGMVASLGLTTSPWLISMRGMEIPLFLAFLCIAIYGFSSENQLIAGLFGGLAALTRGDGAAFLLAMGATWVITQRHVPWKMVWAALTPALPWFVYSEHRFGHIIPNTLFAKIAQTKSGFLGNGSAFLNGFSAMPATFHFSPWWILLLASASIGVVAYAINWKPRFLAPILLYAAIVVFCYGILWRVPDYSWYYSSPVLALIALASVGVDHIASLGWNQRNAVFISLALATGMGIAILGLSEVPRGFTYNPYMHISSWIRKHTPRTATVAASEIGVIGWYSHRPIIDYMGLLSHRVAEHVASGNFSWWLPHYAPQYWVVHSSAWPFEIPGLSARWFPKAYHKVYVGYGLTIYMRVLPPSEIRAIARHDAGALRYSDSAVLSGLPALLRSRLSGSEKAAIERVVNVYGVRSDLQAAFGKPTHVNLTQLMGWAGGPGISTDNAAPLLAPYRRGIDSSVILFAMFPQVLENLDARLVRIHSHT